MLAAPPHYALFNCPAGATRYASDQRLRIARSNRIYISRLAEDCLGGLPGLLFCIQDTRGPDSRVTLIGDVEHIRPNFLPFDVAMLAGPVGLVIWFASAKAAFMRWLALNVDVIEVWSVALMSPRTSQHVSVLMFTLFSTHAQVLAGAC